MAIGPVQLLVLGFEHPEFHGDIIAELERLKESDMVRVIDALAVHKDADGEIEVAHLSNLSKDEAIELGSKVGALVGLASAARTPWSGHAATAICLRARFRSPSNCNTNRSSPSGTATSWSARAAVALRSATATSPRTLWEALCSRTSARTRSRRSSPP